MTLAVPARTTSERRRRGAVYGLNILDPDTRRVLMDYVGQTRQAVRSREIQHREDQPFSDLIVGDAVVLESGMWTDAELDAREQAWIAKLAPRYNYEHNQTNRARIPIPVARRQRWERDDAAGRPRWVPPDLRVDVGEPAAVGFTGGTARSWRWRGWHLWIVAWVLLWPPLFAAIAEAGGSGWPAAGVGALVALALLGWGIGRARTRRRSWWWLRPRW